MKEKIVPIISSFGNLADISNFGTAAYKDVGTSEGDVPVLSSNGKLSKTILPPLIDTLYDNESGTTGTVVLSNSAANYDYITIFAGEMYPVGFTICNPNNKYAVLSIGKISSEEWVYSHCVICVISGTSITPTENRGYIRITPDMEVFVTNNVVNIFKVIGYKYY